MTYLIYFAHNLLIIGGDDATSHSITRSELTVDRLVPLLEEHGTLHLPCADAEEEYSRFKSQFKFVRAGGGVVIDSDGRYLLIYRNGRWDLPKGHLEAGERIEDCAVREVEEETGIEGIAINAPLCATLHCYRMKGVWEIKQTEWFSMYLCGEKNPLKPQLEEGIERVEWVDRDLVSEYISDSFPTVKSVISHL